MRRLENTFWKLKIWNGNFLIIYLSCLSLCIYFLMIAAFYSLTLANFLSKETQLLYIYLFEMINFLFKRWEPFLRGGRRTTLCDALICTTYWWKSASTFTERCTAFYNELLSTTDVWVSKWPLENHQLRTVIWASEDRGIYKSKIGLELESHEFWL